MAATKVLTLGNPACKDKHYLRDDINVKNAWCQLPTKKQAAPEKKSTTNNKGFKFQLSQNMCKSLDLGKRRNPRKHSSVKSNNMSKEDSIEILEERNSKLYIDSDGASNASSSSKSSLYDEMNMIYNERKAFSQPINTTQYVDEGEADLSDVLKSSICQEMNMVCVKRKSLSQPVNTTQQLIEKSATTDCDDLTEMYENRPLDNIPRKTMSKVDEQCKNIDSELVDMEQHPATEPTRPDNENCVDNNETKDQYRNKRSRESDETDNDPDYIQSEKRPCLKSEKRVHYKFKLMQFQNKDSADQLLNGTDPTNSHQNTNSLENIEKELEGICWDDDFDYDYGKLQGSTASKYSKKNKFGKHSKIKDNSSESPSTMKPSTSQSHSTKSGSKRRSTNKSTKVNAATRKLSENFVRLNMKKKSFSRGKNKNKSKFSKYKKNWQKFKNRK